MKKWFPIVIVLLVISCTSDPEVITEGTVTSTDFFPMDEGHTVSYHIQEIIYRSEGLTVDSLSYQLQERMSGTIEDGAQKVLRVVDRYIRADATEEWEYLESWFAQIDNNRAIRIEDNRKYIKLRLPETTNDNWDGNALFDDSALRTIGGEEIDYFKNWQSRLIEYENSTIVNDQDFDAVHVVSLADHENRLEIRQGIEKYGRGIGLIYKKLMILDTQCFDACANEPWEQKAEKGHIYIQEIIQL